MRASVAVFEKSTSYEDAWVDPHRSDRNRDDQDLTLNTMDRVRYMSHPLTVDQMDRA